jgi:hypothetical protein
MSVTFNGSEGFTTNSGAVYDGLQRLTSQTATGVEVTFTGIPSWAKRITIMSSNVSTNGTTGIEIQVGDITGFGSTIYYSSSGTITGTNAVNTQSQTSVINFIPINSASDVVNSVVQLFNITGNQWVISNLSTSNQIRARIGSGKVVLNNRLDRILVTINGTEQFDAGSINVMYE